MSVIKRLVSSKAFRPLAVIIALLAVKASYELGLRRGATNCPEGYTFVEGRYTPTSGSIDDIILPEGWWIEEVDDQRVGVYKGCRPDGEVWDLKLTPR